VKILQYCQHVLGVGHFFRTLEILRALSDHEVILVTGGDRVAADPPPHVREVHLPALMMDADFKALHGGDEAASVEAIQAERKRRLFGIFEETAPDLFLVELYPFGRKKFRFELDPVLAGIREGTVPPCRTACGLRDILVEKDDAASYENRVVKTLNRWFDALLIHADPKLIRLEETFSRVSDLDVEIVYTGFVTPQPAPDARERVRRSLGIGADEKLIVASAGGGKVGAPLLEAAIEAFPLMKSAETSRLLVFTGPYMDDDVVDRLQSRAGDRVRVSRFTSDFLSHLAAADLSVSMGGYNTAMNILAARVPALVWPFARNREQRLRAERLIGLGAAMRVLEDDDLKPARLARLMADELGRRERPEVPVDLDGAARTALWVNEPSVPLSISRDGAL
jgi:predicted glycosyltransferase